MRSKQITPASLNSAQVREFFDARRATENELFFASPKLELRIGKKTFAVTDLADASRVYQRERDKSKSGASRFPEGRVGEYRISFNGRVWLGEWKAGQKPVMEAAL